MSKPFTVTTSSGVTGAYRVEDDMVIVSYRGRTKAAQLGQSPAEIIARIVLREMVDAANTGNPD